MSAELGHVYRRGDRIVTRSIAGECVLVPLASRGVDVDSMYNLNPTAAFVWDQLDGSRDGEAIVGALVDHYQVDRGTAARDYLELVGALAGLGIARLAGDGHDRREE